LETTAESRLRDYIPVLLRRKWLIIVAVAVAVGVAVALSVVSTKVYAATSKVLVESQVVMFSDNGSVVADPSNVPTQIEVMRSRSLAAEVSTRLASRSPLVSAIHIYRVGKSRVVAITTESTNATVARDAATTYARVYVDKRQATAADNVQELVRVLEQRAQEAKVQLNDLDNRIAAAKSPAEAQSLRTQRDSLAKQYALLQQRSSQAGADVSLARGAAQLLEEAALPKKAVQPRTVRNGILALALGLVVGAAAALVFEYFDDTVKTIADVERNARGRRILGAIPFVTNWRNPEKTRLVTVEDPSGSVAEAYRSLRTSLQFIALRQALKTVLVTSPMAEEGKTTTVANLAVTLARSGRRVICVDCDLRRPRLHEFFGLSASIGFTSVLLGDHPMSASVQHVSVPGGGSLLLLAAGPLPPNPAELLGTGRVDELLAAVGADADIVLIDGPALLPTADAATLSSRVGGVLVVATAHVTSRRDLSRAFDVLGQAGAEAIGIVVNGVDVDAEALEAVA
jgi:polysaccharide biosynthesis transport protein